MPSLIDRYEAFAVDLDGVVWRGEEILDGAAAAVAAIRRAGKRLLFLTNNASYLPARVVARLAAAGIDVDEHEVLTSAIAAREWIEQRGLRGTPAMVLGTREVVSQLEDLVEIVPVEPGQQAGLVIVARDVHFTFERLSAASDAVRAGAEFAAVNRDPVMPVDGGIRPGTGAILAAVEAAAGRAATVLGKPEAPMMEAAVRALGRDGVLMVGDRVESDVLGARRVGWDAALVLTGLTAPGDPLEPAPDFVLQSIAGIASDAGRLASYQGSPP